MKATWKDASSYSRGERGNTEPSIWKFDSDEMRVVVHRYHGLDGWFGSCHAMGVERHQLQAEVIDNAQAEFLAYLKRRAERWVAKLATVTP